MMPTLHATTETGSRSPAHLYTYASCILPLLLLLVLYWPGLTNWFYQDDFGWLNLRREVHNFGDLGPALFAPKAHAMIRPLGQNLCFLVLPGLFGIDALPFRIVAFATQMASLVLLGSIARRLTASRAAGFIAQLLWLANWTLAVQMCWSSVYNQILSGFCFLLALYLFQREIETGRRRFYLAQWAAFVLGLGALETNVVYPAIAVVYALLFARAYLKKILAMLPVSMLAVAAHFLAAPAPRQGVYAMHFNLRMAATLWTYWHWALSPRLSIAILLTCAVAALLAWQIRRHDWTGVFGVAWFLIAIAAYLPLSAHLEDYYTAVPSIGVAIVGASGLVAAWRSRPAWKIATGAAIALYLGASLPAARSAAEWHHARGMRAENLVEGVAQIHQREPGKYILLDGIDNDLFWSAIADAPFRALEIPHVYLVPGAESHIQAPPGLPALYTLPESLALSAVTENRAVVYQTDGFVLHNATARYRAMASAIWKPTPPRFLNLGDPAFAGYLAGGWDAPSDGFRRMPATGALRLAAPRGPDEKLYLTVFREGSFPLGLWVDGTRLAPELVSQGDGASEFRAGLPVRLIAKEEITVSLSSLGAGPLRFGFVQVR